MAQEGSLTLEQALEQASSLSPVIRAATKEVDATGGAVQQAGLRPNPEFSAGLEDTSQRDTRVTTASIGLPIELGGKRLARIAAAERARDVAIADLSTATAELKAQVYAAYFQTLVAQERARLANDSLELASRAADAVGKRVTAGKVSPVELNRARVDQANAQLELTDAESTVRTAQLRLATAIGLREVTFANVSGNIERVPDRPSYAQLVSRIDESPILLSGRLEIDRRRAVLASERSKAYPDVTVSVGTRRDAQLGRTQAVVGLSIPLPLFNRNQGNVYEAARRADKAEDEAESTRLRVITSLRDASNTLDVARQSLDVLKTTVLPAAAQAYDAATKGFEGGKFGFLEVLDAQRSFLAARTRYLNTLLAAYDSAATIDRLTGR